MSFWVSRLSTIGIFPYQNQWDLANSSPFHYLLMPLQRQKTFVRYWDFSIPSAEVRPTQISKYNTALQLLLMGCTTVSPLIPFNIPFGLLSLQWVTISSILCMLNDSVDGLWQEVQYGADWVTSSQKMQSRSSQILEVLATKRNDILANNSSTSCFYNRESRGHFNGIGLVKQLVVGPARRRVYPRWWLKIDRTCLGRYC